MKHKIVKRILLHELVSQLFVKSRLYQLNKRETQNLLSSSNSYFSKLVTFHNFRQTSLPPHPIHVNRSHECSAMVSLPAKENHASRSFSESSVDFCWIISILFPLCCLLELLLLPTDVRLSSFISSFIISHQSYFVFPVKLFSTKHWNRKTYHIKSTRKARHYVVWAIAIGLKCKTFVEKLFCSTDSNLTTNKNKTQNWKQHKWIS